ncbi:MAG: hypothetical protein IPM32_03270 [Ignavibacteriae bacterium]|nr:hypothetical protein [Ignavibacteriota bacterium]
MKKIIFSFFLIYSTNLYAQTNYFVSNDGSGNFSTIKEINSKNLKFGDIVSFKGGQQFSDAVLICKQGVTYNSYGNEKAILGDANGNTSNEATINVNSQNVTLDNLKIFGFKEAENAVIFSQNELTIKNCEIIGGKNAHRKWSYGIKQTSKTSSNVSITQNKISGFGGAGIFWNRPLNFEVSYNEIFDLWRIDSKVNDGAQAIQRATFGNGKSPEDVWDCAYTVNVHHNNIHHFEMAAFMGYSRIIFEYNEIHHNLDERIYRGGVKHGSVGKLWDNYGTSDNEISLGSLGLIFRYNYVHDLNRFGKANYTYGESTEYHRINGIVPDVVSTNNSKDHPIYLGSGLEIYSNGMKSEYADDFNSDGKPDFLGAPDYVISGLGYGNFWIHNNVFYNCSNQIIGRAYNYHSEYYTNLISYFINNTILDCGSQSHLTDDNGLMITQANSQSPHVMLNNIIDFTSPSARYTGRWREDDLYLGFNIYTNQGGTTKDNIPTLSSNKAAFFEYSSNESAKIENELYFIPKENIWNNSNQTLFVFNIGINGTSIPDLRIKNGGTAYNQGKPFNTIGDNFTVKSTYWSESHKIGEDPTGRSFAYDILGNFRTTNDIGAMGVSDAANVIPNPVNSSPVIISHPQNINANLNETVSININATCDDPIGYQWWKSPYVNETESKIKDGDKYSGATTNTLTIKNLSTEDANSKFICEVYNTKDHSNLWLNSNTSTIFISTVNTSEQTNLKTGLKVLLEAAILPNKLNSALNEYKLLPNSQPYNVNPWNFNGNEKISDMKTIFVDWLIVELRDNLNSVKYTKAAVLGNDGSVYNTDGAQLFFTDIINGDYYIAIKHRNHLNIVSSEKVQIQNGINVNYDFTGSANSAYGINALTLLKNGKYGMIAGDTDANGVINNLDFGIVANNIPSRAYHQGDLDMNGIVNVLDYSLINKNILKRTNVSN